jgi:glycerophosphoryl diester phosphodiesterase
VSVWAGATIVVGHRGGRGDGWPPENTIPAFEQAVRQGASAIELDVRTCAASDAAVVFHDATLSRATRGRDGRSVSDLELGELRAMGVPTLDAVLSWARALGIGVNVEMKHDVVSRAALVRATARAVRATRADVLFSSFDPLLLGLVAFAAPSVPRALLVRPGQPKWADALQRAARPPLFGWLHMERAQVDPAALVGCARRGVRVGVWTVNDPREAVDLVGRGVASIITDDAGAVSKALSFTRN